MTIGVEKNAGEKAPRGRVHEWAAMAFGLAAPLSSDAIFGGLAFGLAAPYSSGHASFVSPLGRAI